MQASSRFPVLYLLTHSFNEYSRSTTYYVPSTGLSLRDTMVTQIAPAVMEHLVWWGTDRCISKQS